MLVNENRLNLADARARQYLARQMEQFFFGGEGPTSQPGFVPSCPPVDPVRPRTLHRYGCTTRKLDPAQDL
jgi:hypothetical protein